MDKRQENNTELDIKDESKLDFTYSLANTFVKKNYLSLLSDYEVVPVPEEIKKLRIRDSFRFFKVKKIVYDKNENNLDKLSNVYNALDNIDSSLIMVIDSDGVKVNLYLGIKVERNIIDPTVAKNVLRKSFKGNFPGSELCNLANNEIEEMLTRVTESKSQEKDKIISAVSGIPSLKDDKDNFVQGIEKLIDAMQGERFSAIFISDSIAQYQIEEVKAGYERIYSELFPFAQSQLSFGENESKTVSKGITMGFTKTINESLTQTQSYTKGKSITQGYTENESTTKNPAIVLGVTGAALGSIVPGVGTLAGGIVGGKIGAIAGGLIGSKTKGSSETYSETDNVGETKGESKIEGESESRSLQQNRSEAKAEGSSTNFQLNLENKTVSNLLERIDEQLDRLKDSQNFGMWNSACYFLADDPHTANVAASTFKALMRGEDSATETAFVNTWDNDNQNNLVRVKNYLEKFSHPHIDLNVESGLNTPYVSPGSLISGKELTIQLGLPVKSVNGITVIESAEFGRNILTYDERNNKEKIKLGKLFHMGQPENTDVELDVDSLAMHTFITGSTGSGKSNTIYKILAELDEKDKSFLVIEPAKGEYKEVFGGREDVNVYGTNPKYTELLKINPFKFPDDIHVLEHIDRLVEIFNACWPMYAAMPAVLKEGIERAYELVGWDLERSLYLGSTIDYPNFDDLLKTLPKIIEESAYSQKLKGDYIGALVTRVRSLTTGLIGRIFAEEEIENDKLFNQNCIVDLSRIGSVETKSLLMGILFMRLHEDRYANFEESNSSLKHITVLEEAHHLLRKSSFAQNQESTNLQGKSVEMISNAIAEMRTYGQGFIIADQSPDSLDASVIKNTNTKIILKLPDESDRQLVGKAANLNDDQIIEVSKLKTGVAAIYQNNWLEPILCLVDEYKEKEPLKYEINIEQKFQKDKQRKSELLRLLLQTEAKERSSLDLEAIDIDRLKKWLLDINLAENIRETISDNLKQYQDTGEMQVSRIEKSELTELVDYFIDKDKLINYSSQSNDFIEWNEKFRIALRNYVDMNDYKLESKLIDFLLSKKVVENSEYEELYDIYIDNIELGGELI